MVVRDVVTGCLGVLLLATSAGWAWSSWKDGREDERQNQALSELVLRAARAEGLVVAVAEERDDALAEISDSAQALARIRGELEAVGVENVRLARIAGELRTWLEGTGSPQDTAIASEAGSEARPCPVSECLVPGDVVSGEIERGGVFLAWEFHALDRLVAEVTATVRAQVVQADLPDGSVAFLAESLTEGFTLEVEEFVWQPPPPPRVSFHLPSAGWGFLAGGTAGTLATAFACNLGR